MNVLLTVLLTLVMFAIIICVHESGHLLCAKLCGIYVEEFSIGMGPLICSFKKGTTKYSLRALPIGGYCKMPGEDGESEFPDGFDKKPVAKRMLVVAGGALFNIIFAALIFIIAFMGIGVASDKTVIGEVSPGYPAEAAGIKAGDLITAVEGNEVNTWNDMTGYIKDNAGKELTFSVERDGEALELAVTPEEIDGSVVIGIISDREPMPLFTAIKTGFVETYEITRLILVSLGQMVTGAIGVDLAGPVGVGQMVGQVAQYGLFNFLLFVGIISVNLGVINLLPLPALDGSRLCFLLIEAVRRKPVNRELEGRIHFIGFALLMVLFVVITYSDILRIIK